MHMNLSMKGQEHCDLLIEVDRFDCTVYLFMMMTNEMNGLQSYDNPLV
jgi:hypothetical protein